MDTFSIDSPFRPTGDQPKAIREIVSGFRKHRIQTLLGVTGSGKTFTMAHVIAKMGMPALILSHNKTLAAQLYGEFRDFFPKNKVCYFVSYYDYYQPESYIPESDTYIEKDAMINEEIERMRLEAASALLTRRDVIIVASVSCIYGFGSPNDFSTEGVVLKVHQTLTPQELSRKLIAMQYSRNDYDLRAGRFRVRGDTVDIIQGSGTTIIRVVFLGDEIEKIYELEFPSNEVLQELEEVMLFPAQPYIVPVKRRQQALESIRKELQERLPQLGPLEAYRLKQRTEYDLEMIEQLGYCKGIENYSRHFDGRPPGSHPYTLLDFFQYAFQKNWLLFIDESHVTIPQVKGMYRGDFSRKKNLVDYGFRLPSAYDNRPLMFQEFEEYYPYVLFVSATPEEYERSRSEKVVEQIIRPTGLVDPEVIVRKTENQINDITHEVRNVKEEGYRTLITTLTKRLAEDLTQYFLESNISAAYLHSDIKTLDRNDIIRNFRLGNFDVLVGINLLREGLDLPEVKLVIILDADKEGFLRNETSLIQTIGRAARCVDSRVILYADTITPAMQRAIDETERRRSLQMAYNRRHGITPRSVIRTIPEDKRSLLQEEMVKEFTDISDIEREMYSAAEELDFERAIQLRDLLKKLRSESR